MNALRLLSFSPSGKSAILISTKNRNLIYIGLGRDFQGRSSKGVKFNSQVIPFQKHDFSFGSSL